MVLVLPIAFKEGAMAKRRASLPLAPSKLAGLEGAPKPVGHQLTAERGDGSVDGLDEDAITSDLSEQKAWSAV